MPNDSSGNQNPFFSESTKFLDVYRLRPRKSALMIDPVRAGNHFYANSSDSSKTIDVLPPCLTRRQCIKLWRDKSFF